MLSHDAIRADFIAGMTTADIAEKYGCTLRHARRVVKPVRAQRKPKPPREKPEPAPRVAVKRVYKSRPFDPLAYRLRYLPDQLAATRHKLRALENEARRLGMFDLLETQGTAAHG